MKVQLPARRPCDTFPWMVERDSQSPGSRWFIDGSLFDEAKRHARRTGFGIVVVDLSGWLIGFANGVSPRWINDGDAAELWGFYKVARLKPFLPSVITDCKGIIDTLQGCPSLAGGYKRALAGTWNILRGIPDDDFDQALDRVVWMPPHRHAAAIEHAMDWTGKTISGIMWRSRRLAEALAKAAAAKHRWPSSATHKVPTAKNWVCYQAARLGVATHAANNHMVTAVSEDGMVSTRTIRDSAGQRRYARPKRHGSSCVASSQPMPELSSAEMIPHGTLNRSRKRRATAALE